MSENKQPKRDLRNYDSSGSLITGDSSTGVIYVLHWYQARCTFGSPPPQYKYLNQGVQSINALRNLNALTEVISSSISASESSVLGAKDHCLVLLYSGPGTKVGKALRSTWRVAE